MKEQPILFSGEMVRAILDWLKTQTRRVVKPALLANADICKVDGPLSIENEYGDHIEFKLFCPYGEPGDRLWVRESVQIYGYWVKNGFTKIGKQRWEFITDVSKQVRYAGEFVQSPADKTQLGFYKRPSIHMPRWASRITLEIENVRVERLQEISEYDAMAEGACASIVGEDLDHLRYRAGFQTLWNRICKENTGSSWADNPFVWVIQFKLVSR